MMSQMKTALIVTLLLLLSGCAVRGTVPSRFYTLTPLGPDTEPLSETPEREASLGIGPVMIPDYLDRQQIVTRSQNNIELSEFNRWAGTLTDNFSRVLSENLSILLSTERVVLFPRRGSAPLDYEIAVDVIRFDGELGGNVYLIARWGIYDTKKEETLAVRKSSIIEPVGTKGYKALVAAQSRALAGLSRDIAVAVKNLLQGVADR